MPYDGFKKFNEISAEQGRAAAEFQEADAFSSYSSQKIHDVMEALVLERFADRLRIAGYDEEFIEGALSSLEKEKPDLPQMGRESEGYEDAAQTYLAYSGARDDVRKSLSDKGRDGLGLGRDLFDEGLSY